MFVASFIGAPPMNMLPAGGAGRPKPPAGAATLGFRPEDAVIGAVPAEEAGLGIAVTVEAVEPVGAESFLHCAGDGRKLVVRVAGRSGANVGDRLLIGVPREKLHWFDKADRRLG